MRTIAAFLVTAGLLLSACEEALPPAPPPPVPAPPAETAAPTATATATPAPATSAPVDASPTVLDFEQKARDKALVPQASAIVDAYSNMPSAFSSLAATLSRDKKRVLYASNRDGVPEIYVGDVRKPGEAPLAITKGPERAIWAAFTRDDKFILFTRDEGADENWRIWRAAPDGSSPTLLTPGPKLHRDEPMLPRSKPKTMVYTTHVVSSPASQLVVQGIAGGDPKVVYEDPSPIYGSDVTADGARALLLRWISASEVVALEVDTAGGKPAARLYPPEGAKANVTAASYSPDGKLVYIATDEGKEGFVLLAIDPKTRAEKARWTVDEPKSAGIGGLAVSPTGDRLAVMIDAGNHDEIRVLDARKLTLQRKLDIPLGLGGVGTFTEDGKSFSYWLSTPDHPADIFLCDAAAGTSTPLRDDKRAGIDALPKLAVSIAKVPAFDGLSIPVNLYLPKDAAGRKLPVLVMFHGGPSDSSAVRWNPFVRFFSTQGYAVVEPNIRGSTGFGRAYEMADDREKRAGVLEDMASVNAWTKVQPWCDPNRVVVFGGSYGGYVTLMALTRQPTRWRAGVDLFGVADLKTFLKSTDAAIRSAFVQEFGDLDKDSALLDEYSPSRDYDKIVSPLFVYAGQNDPRVPRSESDQIVTALRRRNVPVEYMVAADEGHSIDRRENKIELMTRVARFLADNTK
jgi:dipeptidyl aminopeptidase/acylaminoacyl peptidase